MLAAALEDLASPPLFGGPQVLVIRRAETLRDDEQERVLAVLPGLRAGGALILVSRSSDLRKKILAACVRAGAGVACAPVDPRTAQTWVGRLVREAGSEIAPPAAAELVDRVGNDLSALAHEVEKLLLHAGAKQRIDVAHVRAVTSAVRAHGVDELTDRLARRDVPGAVRALRHLLEDGEAPLRVLGFLAANLRRALHVAELAEAGFRPDEVATKLGMPAWLVQKSAGRARASDLARALHVLRRLDQELKSATPEAAAFEAALLEIAS